MWLLMTTRDIQTLMFLVIVNYEIPLKWFTDFYQYIELHFES